MNSTYYTILFGSMMALTGCTSNPNSNENTGGTANIGSTLTPGSSGANSATGSGTSTNNQKHQAD
ncbi:MAG: hypothetical protein ACJ8LG_02190 [Massilia sp.]